MERYWQNKDGAISESRPSSELVVFILLGPGLRSTSPTECHLKTLVRLRNAQADLSIRWAHIYCCRKYEGESISNQPNLFPVEIHLFFSM